MLAGLCNLCEDYGDANFSSLKDLVQMVGADSPQYELSGTEKNITTLQRYMYLKTKFSREVYTCLL